jgi:hypothetical protein
MVLTTRSGKVAAASSSAPDVGRHCSAFRFAIVAAATPLTQKSLNGLSQPVGEDRPELRLRALHAGFRSCTDSGLPSTMNLKSSGTMCSLREPG